MDSAKKPSFDIAKRVLPGSLLKALDFIFSNASKSCLVGGTALAGFYAEHRRSDDIDLFTQDDFTQKAAVSAALSLVEIGATISGQRESRHHFHCLAQLDGHRFTIDIVMDTHFHTIPGMQIRLNKLTVATLEGLLTMKIATLVSRCSEKDLYDLIWLFENYRTPHLSELVTIGQKIDTGVSEESILISLSGAQLKESSCHFAEEQGVSAKAAFGIISKFKERLFREYSSYLKQKPEVHELKHVLDKLKKRID